MKNVTVPEFPDEFRRYLEWDLSPRRPWEDWLTDAKDYELARVVQDAWQRGIADAQDEHRAKGKA